MREGVKIQDGADETETVAVEKVILDTPVPNAPNGENGEPRSGNGHLPIGPRHIVKTEAQGKKRTTESTSKGKKQTRAQREKRRRTAEQSSRTYETTSNGITQVAGEELSMARIFAEPSGSSPW